jgi:hypothetical protein
MKLRNNWKVNNKQWDKFAIRCRLGYVDVITIEIDISREFYMFTLFNFTLKNR